MGFSFNELAQMISGRREVGNIDVPCPVCGPDCRAASNRTRKVLSVKINDDGNGIVYYCQRCGIKGVAFPDRKSKSSLPKVKPSKSPTDRSQLARELWERSAPIAGTPAELYLTKRQCLIQSANIRFLRGHGKHHHAMIARFSSKDGSTNGIHLTRIDIDGSKADVEPVKIMLGPSMGWPIIVAVDGDTRRLCVAEGIEDAATMALAIGASAWAAGSANRIARVLKRAKQYTEILVATDDDPAGHAALAEARKVRPDLISVSFNIDDDKLDANKTMVRYGGEVVRSCIENARGA